MSIQTGLLSYFKFEGNSIDSVGTNTGTDTSISYSVANGKLNQGAGFNGTTSKITLPDVAYGIGTAFTFAGWIKTSSANEQGIYCRDIVATLRAWQFRVDATTGLLRIVRFDSAGSLVVNLVSSGAVNTGLPVHVAVTFSTTNGTILYINGSADGSDTTVGGKTANNNNTGVVSTFGNDVSSLGTSPMNGFIDEFGIWTTEKTSPEISQLYNTGKGLTYDFNLNPSQMFLSM